VTVLEMAVERDDKVDVKAAAVVVAGAVPVLAGTVLELEPPAKDADWVIDVKATEIVLDDVKDVVVAPADV
jgi:hypothetical protein